MSHEAEREQQTAADGPRYVERLVSGLFALCVVLLMQLSGAIAFGAYQEGILWPSIILAIFTGAASREFLKWGARHSR